MESDLFVSDQSAHDVLHGSDVRESIDEFGLNCAPFFRISISIARTKPLDTMAASIDDEPFDPFGLEEHSSSETTDSFADPFANVDELSTSVEEETKRRRRQQQRPITSPNTARLQANGAQSVVPPSTLTPDSLYHSGISAVVPPHPLNKIYTSSSNTTTKTLPPKITVKLTIHEEATAAALPQGSTGSSYVSLEGRIQAQIQCSDAMKNCPFRLVAQDPLDIFNVNPLFVSGANHEVNVPKHEVRVLVALFCFVGCMSSHTRTHSAFRLANSTWRTTPSPVKFVTCLYYSNAKSPHPDSNAVSPSKSVPNSPTRAISGTSRLSWLSPKSSTGHRL